MKIFYKIFLSFFSVCFFTLLVIYFIFYTAFEEALLNRTYDQLSSINVLKKDHLEEFFHGYQNKITFFLESHKPNQGWDLDELYQNLQSAKQSLLYQDFAILDKNASVLKKEVAVGLNHTIASDPLQFESLVDSAKGGYYASDVFFSDSLGYVLLGGYPVKSIGDSTYVVVFQLPINGVEKILYQRTGMGSSGESYITGTDLILRTKSRFYPDSPPMRFKVEKEAIDLSIGIKNKRVIPDYRGIDVLSVSRKLEVKGLSWIVLTEIDLEEAMEPVNTIRSNVFGTSMLVCILVILVTLYLSNRLTKPVINVQEVVKKFALGEFKVKLHHHSEEVSDEISDMVISINSLGAKLTKLARVADEIGNGNFDIEFKPLSEKDILGLALLQMKDKLKLSKELETSATRKQQLAFVNGQENERKRVARELHDGISQMVSAARFNVSAIQSEIELRDGAKEILDDTIKEIKRISHNLMPRLLEDFGLEAALKQLCEDSKVQADFQLYFEFDSVLKQVPLSREVALCLFRIAQEGLYNIVKYANACSVRLILKLKDDVVSLVLKDDGQGFEAEEELTESPHHNGLKNIVTRTSLVNGQFHIETEPGNGTEISVEIPLKSKILDYEKH